jgi:hypothetical protein
MIITDTHSEEFIEDHAEMIQRAIDAEFLVSLFQL